MSRAADDKLFIAPLSKGLPPPRPLSLLRARRTGELFLIWHLAFFLLLEWRARREPLATFAMVLDVGGGALSKRDRAELSQELAKELVHPEPPETTAMLEAAGRWLCRIQLPLNEDDLMGGQPLRLRPLD